MTESNYFDRAFHFSEGRGMATCIVGGRRTGKTSLMKNYVKKLIDNGLEREKICYLSFFSSYDTSFSFSLISDAYFSLYPEYIKEEVYSFLDEIESIPSWGGGGTYLMERYPLSHVFITGSSAKYLSSEIPTELRERSLSWQFHPLSFREFLPSTGCIMRKKTMLTAPTTGLCLFIGLRNIWSVVPTPSFIIIPQRR